MIRRFRFATILFALGMVLALSASAFAQANTGTINGTATDSSGAALPGAKIALTPGNLSTTSDVHGGFSMLGVAPGQYKISVSYVGFAEFEQALTVTAGQVANVTAVLQVATKNEEVIVTAARAHGEAAAINVERNTDNVIDDLPADIIRSLPNPNIASAVSRLPGVTVERDEGSPKYVQIRGTEPKLSNTTLDGVELPSAEPGIRQVKLDVVPADLVQSVQIYKTLEADQPADAIGGSVNLVTKSAGAQPIGSLYFGQGYSPLGRGALVDEVTGTGGRSFGADDQLGLLISGSYDYNGRKTFDLEPVPGVFENPAGSGNFIPYYSTAELRNYQFTRHRWGLGGTLDYKVSNNSSIYAHFLYSRFDDWGRRYDYIINTNPVIDGVNNTNLPQFTTEARLPNFLISSYSVGGLQVMRKWEFNWRLSASPAYLTNSINGGENIVTFNYTGTTSNCQYDAAATTNPYYPQFTPACFTEAFNPANLVLSTGNDPNATPAYTDTHHGRFEHINLAAMASVARQYQVGSTYGTLQLGFSIRNEHMFDDSYEYDYTANTNFPATMFLTNQTSPNYYYGHEPFGPFMSWDKAVAFIKADYAANPSDFTVTNTLGGNPGNFDLTERVPAGYVMNSLDFGRFHLVAGVRFEGTQDHSVSYESTPTLTCYCAKFSSTYIDVLPSASLSMRLDQNSDVRFSFGRELARPDPTALTQAVIADTTTQPYTYTIGNPNLKNEHAYDYDVLYERTLTPLGIVRAGFFYKSISDPFVQLLTAGTGQYQGDNVLEPANGGSAYITGIELEFAQQFTYLPGPLRGLGLSGNYSYTTSQAKDVNPGNRSDSPALLRQAPNTWNLSPTYDRGRFSMRVGLNYNGPNIYAYQYVDGAPLGKTGPFGDQYLYAHFQVDVEGSYRLGKGFTFLASGWNLNNEVYGLYNGSTQYVLQREFYGPTFMGGIRWDLHHE